MNDLHELSRIMGLYTTDYKQLVDRETSVFKAKYSSYKSLLKIYPPVRVYERLRGAIEEVQAIAFGTDNRNVHERLFNMFQDMNNHIHSRDICEIPEENNTLENEDIILTFFEVDNIFREVAFEINALLKMFRPIVHNSSKITKPKKQTTAIVFSEETVIGIIDVLRDKVDSVNNLRLLLKGNDIVVDFIGQRNQLADLFKRVNKDRIYQDTVLSRWVTANFTSNGAELNYNTIYDFMKGKKDLTKNKRIGIDKFPTE